MLIRVFEIPPPDGQFCFGGGKPMTFREVDWFRDDLPEMRPEPRDKPLMGRPEGQSMIREFVAAKVYFDSRKAYLVLSEGGSFTIGYSAP